MTRWTGDQYAEHIRKSDAWAEKRYADKAGVITARRESGTSAPVGAVVPRSPDLPTSDPTISKYRNQPVVIEGIRFASKKEARQDAVLVLRSHRSEIQDLRRQVLFPIEVNGVQICDYVADWTYIENGKFIVRDAKGKRTEIYKLKKKLIAATLGVEILET